MNVVHTSEKQLPLVAVVGATSIAGEELIHFLERRAFPMRGLRCLALERHASRRVTFRAEPHRVEPLCERAFDGVDLAFFSAGADLTRAWAPVAADAGAQVIDMSSAFSTEPAVPLIIPGVHAAALARRAPLIAVPSAITLLATAALSRLHQAWSITRLSMVTFHSAFAVEAAAVDAGAASPVADPARQHTGVGLPDLSGLGMSCCETGMNIALGHDGEEERIITETRRILRQPRLPIGMTCIRVPMQRNHTVVISVRFDEYVSPERVRGQIKSAVGLRVVDDLEESCVPRLSEAEGIDEVRVARIRTDSGDPSGRSIAMLVWGDQLQNRAACKAVQIAEALVALRRSERLLL